MPEHFIVIFAIFLAVFTQSLSGFGSALVAMALLPPVLGIQTATPLVAIVMLPLEIFLLMHYRHALNVSAIWRVVVAAIVGIPIGIIFLSQLDEKIVLTVLGVVITGYSLFALLNLRLPQMAQPAWGYVFGFLAGLLGGAYNTSGPPVIVYGNCLRWDRDEFKSNLQGFFLIASLVIAIGHAWNHNLTPEVWRYFLISLPAIAVGIWAGTNLDKFLNPEAFRKIVLILLIIMGIRLIFA
ncbi:MAG: sulfite exporter TauE/SafE family protein [Anaerolineales bacterium]|nr:sulfite exporter TauE/SafE family protein [Chloroflexota bacterium]MBL6980441.1 sulfite exporter TauE/SafE family protein [Anaerolineales bacterium]